MRTASLLIVVLALMGSWEPSSAASVDISNTLQGGNAMGGSGHGTSGVMTGGSAMGPALVPTWGGNGGLGSWGGYGGQGPWNGHCGPNGCGVPQTPNGCKSPSGCKPVAYGRTVANESTDSPGEYELKYEIPIHVRVPVYIHDPREIEPFVAKPIMAKSLTEKFIPKLTQNSEGLSEKRITRNFIEPIAGSVSMENPTSAQDTFTSRVLRSNQGHLNGYLDYGVQN